MGSSKNIVLKCMDGFNIPVSKAVIANQMQHIKHLVDDDDDEDCTIYLPQVSSNLLLRLLPYCERHAKQPPGVYDRNLKDFDEKFLKMHQHDFSDILSGANILGIMSLIELICQSVADMIKGKSPEEICKTFNMENDITPEEAAQIRKDYPWAFK